MAIAQFEKLHLIVHNSKVEDLIADIQSMGFCEQIEEEGSSASTIAGTAQSEVPLDQLQGDIRYLLRVLEPYFKEKKGLERLLSPKPSCTLGYLESLLAVDEAYALVSEVKDFERKLADIKSKETSTRASLDVIEKLSEMPYPLSFFTTGTNHVCGIVGNITTSQGQNFKDALEGIESDQKEIFFNVSPENDKETLVAVIFSRKIEKEILEICSRYGFSKVDLDKALNSEVSLEKEKLHSQLECLSREALAIGEQLSRISQDWVERLRLFSDYVSILIDRHGALDKGTKTSKVVFLKFWVPSSRIDTIKERLALYNKYIDYSFSAPEEGDRPPVLLSNAGFFEVHEPLTNLYGSPAYGSIDPTALMAPFFFLFFGMCLGDGGYGLLLAFIFFGAIKKYGMVGESRKFFAILGLGGIAAILVGVVTGSWIGDMIDLFPFFHFLAPIKNAPAFLDPLSDPITFLIISLALGVVQILFGLSASMIHNLKKGDKMAAFADQGGWIVLLVGLLLCGGGASGIIGSGPMMLGKFLSWTGVIVLVTTQGRHKPTLIGKAISGVLSLYNVTSYLGDVLSYSRLLALGLASSAVAMIINMLADLLGAIPYVGWLFGALIFLGGHLFNVAIGVLGAFVHSLRLQYVEFFSKFYVSGGRGFDPLRHKTRHVTICEGAE